MAARGLRQLPVVRGGVVVGLVSRGQIVRAVAELYSEGSGPAAKD
jgi:predicted transcriptional regulator